jgi:hypothetical protein
MKLANQKKLEIIKDNFFEKRCLKKVHQIKSIRKYDKKVNCLIKFHYKPL